MNKRHIVVLLVLTIIVRGVLFISYPLGGEDDDQAAQHYLINELVDGNWRIGNLRYSTGYPLVIAPIAKLAERFGRLDDRLILLFQIVVSSTLPFLVYDILRRRRSPREAFIVALIMALDPFGLQWAHWWLPVWVVAFCIVFALWLVDRATRARFNRAGWLVALAGLVLGVGILARSEMAVLAAVLGIALLVLAQFSWRQRLILFTVLGVTSAGVWGLYLLTIQKSSTGTVRPNCMGGIDLLFSAQFKGIPLVAENGPQTAHLLELLSIEPEQEVLIHIYGYQSWQQQGPWVTEAEQAAFLSRPVTQLKPQVDTTLPSNLVYYLGLCPTDELLNEALLESVPRYPLRWLANIGETAFDILVHQPASCCEDIYLVRYDLLSLHDTAHPLFNRLGFRIADVPPGQTKSNPYPFNAGSGFYTGQVVWAPGIWLVTHLFRMLTWVFWLVPLAVIWALFSRDWFYATAAALLLSGALVIAIFNIAQPRIYAPLYPLSTILIGGLLAQGVAWGAARRGRREPTV